MQHVPLPAKTEGRATRGQCDQAARRWRNNRPSVVSQIIAMSPSTYSAPDDCGMTLPPDGTGTAGAAVFVVVVLVLVTGADVVPGVVGEGTGTSDVSCAETGSFATPRPVTLAVFETVVP